MTLRTKTALILLAIVSTVAVSSSHAQEKFRLKPGAKGKVCLTCHESFKEKLKLPFVHTPVKAGDCSDCHNPHTSSYGKLLASNVNRICLSCHDGIVPGKARSTHKVAAEGNCVKCHDPHAAKYRNNLLAAGNALCFGCHQRIAKQIAGNRFQHNPVEKGCLSCHTPHASRENALLKKPQLPLCGECHMDTIERLEKSAVKHKPAQEGNCTKCHLPHSSNNVFLLDNTSPINLCGTCHDWQKHSSHPIGEKVTDKRNRNLTMDCSSCHAPHGSDQKRFAWYDVKIDLCVQCHEQYKR